MNIDGRNMYAESENMIRHLCVNVLVCAGSFSFFGEEFVQSYWFLTPWEFGQGCWSSRATTSFDLVNWAWSGAQMGWRMGQRKDAPKFIKNGTEMRLWKQCFGDFCWDLGDHKIKTKLEVMIPQKFQRMEATRVKNHWICQPPGFNRSPWSLSREACHKLSKTLAPGRRSWKVPKRIPSGKLSDFPWLY